MQQTTPFDNILAQCRDLFTEKLVAAVSAMLDNAENALLEMMQATRDPNLDALYRETRDKVKAEREAIVTQFRARYLREFQQRSNHAKKIGGSLDDIDLDSIELALVGEDDLNETLKFNAMASRLRQYCEEELGALDQRVGVLFGDAALPPEDNPFAPQAVCDAYKQTCSQIEPKPEVRLVMLKLFDDHVLDAVRGIYRSVNALLVQNSILPKIRGAVRKERDKEKTPAASETAAQAGDGGDFFSQLQKLIRQAAAPAAAGFAGMGAQGAMPGATMPGFAHGVQPAGTAPLAGPIGAPLAGAPAFGAGVVPQILEGADLMHSLTRLQVGDLSAVSGNTTQLAVIVNEPGTTNVLRELKATSVGGSMSEVDAMTLDIVAMLFDQLFDDPEIPIAIKGLIGRLQIPILKVAIADKAFFSKKHHPARLMLDALGEFAARMPWDVDDTYPSFVRLSVVLNKLMEDYEDDIGVFDDVRQRLQELLREEDERLEQEAQAAEEQIQREERLSLAKTIAQTEIKMRLRVAAVPPAVTDFLAKEWIKVLILTQIKHGEQSEEWKNALETMDLLIWSIEPKNTLEERRELVSKVPMVLRRVTEALALADIEDAVRMRFLADLRKLHSEILTPARAPAAPPAEAAEPPVAVPAEPAPQIATQTPEAGPPAAEATAMPEAEPAVETKVATPEPAMNFELPSLEFSPDSAQDAPPKPTQVPAGEPAPEPDTAPVAGEPAAEPVAKLELPPLDFAPPEPAKPAVPAGKPEPSPVAEATAPKPAEKFELPSLELVPSEPAKPAPAAKPEAPVTPPAAKPSAPAAPAPKQPEPSNPVAAKPLLDFELPPIEPKPAASAKTAAQAQPAAKPATPPKATTPPKPAAPASAATPGQRPAAAPRAPAAGPAPSPAAKQPPPVNPGVQLKPSAPPLARPKPSAPPDFSAPVKVANPFGEGEVEVNDLDFTVVLRGPSDAKPVPALPPEMVLGAWVSIKLRGEQEKIRFARLSYVSPLKTRFLFVDRQGKTALECTQSELVKLLEIGEVTLAKEPPPEQPLFDRMAEGVVNKLGGKK